MDKEGLASCSLWGHRVGHDWVTELNWTDMIIIHYDLHGLNFPPPQIHRLKPWPPNVTKVGDKAFKEITKVKWGHKDEALIL